MAQTKRADRNLIINWSKASGASTQPTAGTTVNGVNTYTASKLAGAITVTGLGTSGDVVTRAARSGPVTIDDGEVIMWLQPGQDNELKVVDRATGKTLFEGPVSTPEQWEGRPVRRPPEV